MIWEAALVRRQRPIEVRIANLTNEVMQTVLDICPVERGHWMATHHYPHGRPVCHVALAAEIRPKMQVKHVLKKLKVGSVAKQGSPESGIFAGSAFQ